MVKHVNWQLPHDIAVHEFVLDNWSLAEFRGDDFGVWAMIRKKRSCVAFQLIATPWISTVVSQPLETLHGYRYKLRNKEEKSNKSEEQKRFRFHLFVIWWITAQICKTIIWWPQISQMCLFGRSFLLRKEQFLVTSISVACEHGYAVAVNFHSSLPEFQSTSRWSQKGRQRDLLQAKPWLNALLDWDFIFQFTFFLGLGLNADTQSSLAFISIWICSGLNKLALGSGFPANWCWTGQKFRARGQNLYTRQATVGRSNQYMWDSPRCLDIGSRMLKILIEQVDSALRSRKPVAWLWKIWTGKSAMGTKRTRPGHSLQYGWPYLLCILRR